MRCRRSDGAGSRPAVLAVLAVALLAPRPAVATPLRQIADVQGVRGNALSGVGVVVGLNGTGDGDSVALREALARFLSAAGTTVDPRDLKLRNAALVSVTAELPAFARAGSEIDVAVQSLGDAKSLFGGTLLATALKGPSGQEAYAVATGPLIVGGAASGAGGAARVKNHPTSARIVDGARVEREVSVVLDGREQLTLALRRPDFHLAVEAAARIDDVLQGPFAHATDPRTVVVRVPPQFRADVATMMARLGDIELEPRVPARVVVNERTGTVVMGQDVRIGRVAVAHGDLTIQIDTTPQVSQPGPLSRGRTEVVEKAEVALGEKGAELRVVHGVTISEVVAGLNALGVTPVDLIEILQQIRAAGALDADLVSM